MKHAIFTLICLLAASAMRADDATKTLKIEEFFRLTKTEEALRQSFAITSKQLKTGMVQ